MPMRSSPEKLLTVTDNHLRERMYGKLKFKLERQEDGTHGGGGVSCSTCWRLFLRPEPAFRIVSESAVSHLASLQMRLQHITLTRQLSIPRDT